MSIDWFGAWAQEYAALVGFNTPEELRSAALWRNVFVTAGYSEAEVRAAAREIVGNLSALANSPERFLGKVPMHLAVLQRRVRALRAVEYVRGGHSPDQSYNDRNGICDLCGNTARVVVPHLASVRNGQWVGTNGTTRSNSVVFYLLAVICCCPLGSSLLLRLDQEKNKFMTLRGYEAFNPKWRQQLSQRQAEQSAINSASRSAATSEERAWQDALLSLAGNYGIRSDAGEEG